MAITPSSGTIISNLNESVEALFTELQQIHVSSNVDERYSLWDLVTQIGGMFIANKGLIGTDYQRELR